MSFFELSKKNIKGGKRRIKMALLEIHTNDTDTNDNGIHWKKEYIFNNLETAVGMPICCEFSDETKTIPLGHGFTEIDTTVNEPLFENSEVVGSITKVYIEDIEFNSETKTLLIGEGYLYQQRYPNFVKWLSESVKSGKILSSIEITGTPENNNNIVYEEEQITDDFRTPKEFVFSGTAILSVEAADKSAIVIEINNLNREKENKMDEKTIALIADTIKNAVNETNAKNSEYEKNISELNQEVDKKTNEINELNTEIEKIRKAIADLESEREAWYAEREELNKMLGEAKAKQRIAEMNDTLKEFTDDERDYAKTEIENYKQNTEVELNSVVSKIYEGIGKKSHSNIQSNTRTTEINQENYDIYSEINSIADKKVEEINIY